MQKHCVKTKSKTKKNVLKLKEISKTDNNQKICSFHGVNFTYCHKTIESMWCRSLYHLRDLFYVVLWVSCCFLPIIQLNIDGQVLFGGCVWCSGRDYFMNGLKMTKSTCERLSLAFYGRTHQDKHGTQTTV